jgi:hypothetical protein
MMGIYKLWNFIPEIDYTRVITDNSYMNERVFGINFSRSYIQSDIKWIFKINHSHISMYVDASIYWWQIKEQDTFNLMGSNASRKKLEDGAL